MDQPVRPARSREPRVVIAHDYVTQRGGAERVVLAMLDAFPGARLVTSIYEPETTFPEFRKHQVETLWLNRFGALRKDPRRALPILAPAVARHQVTDADIIVASSSGWAHAFGPGVPKLVYCHNPARWLYQRSDYVQDIGTPVKAALAALSPALKRWDRAAAGRVTRYVANSTTVRNRIRDAYGFEADLLFPPTTLDAREHQEPVLGIAPGYLLTVSRVRAYKNTEAVCEAVESLQDGTRLVVVGALPEREGGWSDRIKAVSALSDAQMRWVYAHARGLVGVSHEDFGLTPVESYSFGVPSVLLRAGGYLDSSVEGLTTVFVDSETPQAVAAGIRQLLATTWDHAAIRRHAENFSLSAFQGQLRDAVAEVLEGARVPAVQRVRPVATRVPAAATWIPAQGNRSAAFETARRRVG